MLPPDFRLSTRDDFRHTVRQGVRTGRAAIVVHGRICDEPSKRVGFVVSKAVGNAVTRNRVKRRLRHLARDLLPESPAGIRMVVRALPKAASSNDLTEQTTSAWRSCVWKLDSCRPSVAVTEDGRS